MTKNNLNLHPLSETISALRGPDGCPWDIKQTPSTLIKYLKSETEELISAITNEDPDNTCEELGDVLYLLMMITKHHDERGTFTFSDVIAQVNAKLIRRHPHVFAGKRIESQEDLDRQWQEIKAQEKQK